MAAAAAPSGSVTGFASPRRSEGVGARGPSLVSREAHGLAADRIVLAQRVSLPVVVHEDACQLGVPFEADAHQVVRFSLVPVGGRPDGDDGRHRLAVVGPDLQAHARGIVGDPQEVVAHAEALGLRLRQPLQAARRRTMEVAARRRAEVAGAALRAPAEVVGRRDVGQEVEAELVPQMQSRLGEARRIDHERRLAVRLLELDEPGNAAVVQLATPRISYAGGTPASTFSCSRTIPSIKASGRGGQPGTWMSTATILSTPCSVV